MFEIVLDVFGIASVLLELILLWWIFWRLEELREELRGVRDEIVERIKK